MLCSKGYFAEGIHGDIRQTKRDSIMSKFRASRINILVATDVVARGIDVPNVEIVFNYEIPKDVESYVHRIGRTGRAGKLGKALSLVSRIDLGKLGEIRRFTKADITRLKISL
jgi:ATP-dependent RNA helicase DeaD